MEKLQVWLKRMTRMTRKEYLPLWIFAGIQLVYHIFMKEPQESDAMWFFCRQLDAYPLNDYLKTRYEIWSSRLLIEAVLVYISRSVFWWKILDWAFWVFLAWAFVWLFPEEKRGVAAYMVTGFLCLYPIWDLRTAGWIATTVNYTWPLALGVFSLHGVTRAFYGKKTPVPFCLLYGAAALYGANMEQMCAVLLAVNFCAVVYFAFQKKPVRSYAGVLVCFAIAAAEIVFIMVCPGNEARKNQEVINWMPNFKSYHLLDKASMGFLDTMHHLVTSGSLLFLCFLILLAVLVFLRSRQIAFRAAALFPVFLTVWLSWFADSVKADFPTFFKLMNKSGFICSSNYHIMANYIPTVLYLGVVGCMLLSLVAICTTYLELFSQMLLLALGLATRVVIGFTPTIYVSQERTFLFLYMILGISAVYLVQNHLPLLLEQKKTYHALKLAGILLAVTGVILSLAEIGSVI